MLHLIPLFPLLGFVANGLAYLMQLSSSGSSTAHPNAHAKPDAAHSSDSHLVQVDSAHPVHSPNHGSDHSATHPADHASHGASPVWKVGMVGTAAILASFCVALYSFLTLLNLPPESRELHQVILPFISFDSLKLGLALRLDALSSLFTLVITGVGTLIHLYSIGYMSHDPAPGKFFAYLNLFCFAMLVLVMGDSLPLLFFGWEGVGLCSYLLIGFWYQDIPKAQAGRKAFVVNRIGDCGFLIGMFLLFRLCGTLDFAQLKLLIHGLPHSSEVTAQLTVIALSLFVGCAGKSAQIPLFVWLPDAMAGPTPVSALIHAATMVTSGIYLVARLNFLFSRAPNALHVMAFVGALTALMAAAVALKQRDIKKVLAYSTVSQLGYMFLACGVGAYVAGVFHVITHAFFKALLFLGAGSVIHGLDHEQDLGQMGGLRQTMPITAGTFIVGWLAISGVPPFAGFFSKDEILWSAFSRHAGSPLLWVLGVMAAVMTAFYMSRLVALAFLGSPRVANRQVHESPWMMTLPLVVLAGLSATAGLLGIPHSSWLESWLSGVIPMHEAAHDPAFPHLEWVLMGVSTLGAMGGIGAALSRYRNVSDMETPEAEEVRIRGLERLLAHKFYVDEAYETLILKPMRRFWAFLWKQVDVGAIDRSVMSMGALCSRGGSLLKRAHTGSTQIYAVSMVIGMIVVVGLLYRGGV